MEKKSMRKIIYEIIALLVVFPPLSLTGSVLAEESSKLEVLIHETFENDAELVQGAGIEAQYVENFSEVSGAVYTGDRNESWHGFDIDFHSLGMQPEYAYNVTIHGYVNEGEEVPEGAHALLQTPDGDYRLHDSAEIEAGKPFELQAEYEWINEDESRFRIQSNDAAEAIPFYITEILVEWDLNQEIEDAPIDEGDREVLPFEAIDFENEELNGFEGRSESEELVITNEENHTEGGIFSLHVSNRTDNWNGPSLEVTDYIEVGSEHRVSVWVKSETTTQLRLSTQVGEGSNASYNTIASGEASSDEWVQLEGTYRYTSLGGGYVTIYVESSNGLSNFYVDDVEFEVLESEQVEVDTSLASISEVYADHFMIGNAISMGDMEGARLELLNHHHNLVTAENAMKPGEQYDGREFDFSGPNQLVERAREEEHAVHGHVLVWHQQSPDWHHTDSSGNPLPEQEARENMQRHIRETMENYGSNVISWDVVNEALDGDWSDPEDWQSQLRNTGWLRAIGEDYVYEAFLYARQVADENGWEDMVLYYNDYNDHLQPKARTMYYMIRDLNERYTEETGDTRPLISGVGMQGHYNININPEHVRQSLERFIELDIEIGITELDVTTITEHEYVEEEWLRQGYIYASIFQIFKEHSEHISRVTFWGLNDSNSWRSERFPLLFDDRLQVKPAYHAVVDPDGFLKEHDFEEAQTNHSYGIYGTPVIDAEEDEIWNKAPVLPISRFQSAWQGARGVGRVLWDENNLYVRFDVTDSKLDASGEDPWEQDSVEAFIEESGEKAVAYEAGVGQYRVNYQNDTSFNPSNYEEGFESAARTTDSGYVVEMAIPWKILTVEAGHTIGFDLQINDASEGSRQASAAWNDMTGQGFQDPSVFGELTLINSLDDVEIEPEVIEEGLNSEVLPGQTVTIENTQTSITMPADLPQGTSLLVHLLDEEDLPELIAEDGSQLILAGEVVDVTMNFPEEFDGSFEDIGNFELTLGIDDNFLDDEVFIYYYNEEESAWELQGGEVEDGVIRVTVPGFSIYGVFAQADSEDEPAEEEEIEDVEEETDNIDSSDDESATNEEALESAEDSRSEVDSEDTSEEEREASEGERLPQTATATSALAVVGLVSGSLGLVVHFIRKKK